MLRLLRNKKGQGLVEYGLLIAGVALICAATVSLFGHKTNDLLAALTVVLPGAHADDNAPIVAGSLIETTNTGGANGNAITLDLAGIDAANTAGTRQLGQRLGSNSTFDSAGLIVEP